MSDKKLRTPSEQSPPALPEEIEIQKEPLVPQIEPEAVSTIDASADGEVEVTDKSKDDLPSIVPLLPLRADVPFPQVLMPLIVGREKGIRLIDEVLKGNKFVGLVTQKNPEVEDPSSSDLFETLCIATVLKMLRFPDGSTRIVAQGLKRAKLVRIVAVEPYMIGQIKTFEDENAHAEETEALVLTARRLFQRLIESGAQLSDDLQIAAMNTHEAGPLCDLLASGISIATEQKQEILSIPDVSERLRRLTYFLRHQVDMQDLSAKIQGEVTNELTKAQREQFLRQQMDAIRRELGENEEEPSDSRDFFDRIDKMKMPEQAAKEARRELDRMALMHPSSPEYHVIRTFLDTLLSMPWHTSTEDKLDLKRAKRVLDEDHYDLVKIKQRILEFLAVRKLKEDMRGPIICFVGPPGVGKTSLGRSIARAMGRKFYRLSLGGVHDEAEIRGHRRTYIGAMPGRIVQGLRKLNTKNPVFMLDEVDKLGRDFRGDPAAALLEVLDPEQNFAFRDHYLDIEFDLSKVLFICTANTTQTIPSALLDRMELVELSGYSEEEKLAIAHAYLVKKQLTENGLKPKHASFTSSGLSSIIHGYTHEAGVRNFEREIASVCRKIAMTHAEGTATAKVKVDSAKVHALLGPPKYIREPLGPQGVPGVANGLAWTPVGGEILTIETIRVPSKKPNLKLTGSLGDVMKESAHTGLGYLSAHMEEFGIDPNFFDGSEIHIHVPAGATAKDGPSAGIALTASLLSLARMQPIEKKIAMTGEITLTGRVLPVGGIREKVLAARREGIKTVILPANNEKDMQDFPEELLSDLTFILVKHMDEVIPHIFHPELKMKMKRGKAKIVAPKKSTGRSAFVQPS